MKTLTAFIDTILAKMPDLTKPRRKFMRHMLALFLSMRGRYNFLQFARHSSSYCESSYRLHFERSFDFVRFNVEVIKQSTSDHLVAGLDMSHILKSGRHTPGVGKYWSGCDQRSKWGLEAGILAIIDVENRTAFSLTAKMTPNKATREKEGTSYTQHCASIVIDNKEALESLTSYLAVDAWFTKKDFIESVRKKTDLHLIGRLRVDANMRYKFQGDPTGRPGRPRKYAGKVDWDNPNMEYFELVYEDEKMKVYDARLNSFFLRCDLRVALVERKMASGKEKRRIYFSTDVNLPALQVLEYYQLRFQEEFLIRDAKQFTGLQHAQSRSENKIEFHWNASLTAVNLAKAVYWLSQPAEERGPFSLRDIKNKLFNELFIETFFKTSGNRLELKENIKDLSQIFNFAARAA